MTFWVTASVGREILSEPDEDFGDEELSPPGSNLTLGDTAGVLSVCLDGIPDVGLTTRLDVALSSGDSGSRGVSEPAGKCLKILSWSCSPQSPPEYCRSSVLL